MLVKQKFFYFLIIKLSIYYTLKILNRKYGYMNRSKIVRKIYTNESFHGIGFLFTKVKCISYLRKHESRN